MRFTSWIERRSIAFRLADKYGWVCWYCNRPLKPPVRVKPHHGNGGIPGCHRVSDYPHIDHVLALCQGGAHTIDNMALACAMCNMAKGDALVEEFIEWLDAIRFGPTWSPIKDYLKAPGEENRAPAAP